MSGFPPHTSNHLFSMVTSYVVLDSTFEMGQLSEKLYQKFGSPLTDAQLLSELSLDDPHFTPREDRCAIFLLVALNNSLFTSALTILRSDPPPRLTKTDRDFSALHAAIRNRNTPLEVIRAILERAPESIKDLHDGFGETALFHAVFNQYTAFVRLLLEEYKTNPNTPCKNGNKPLLVAAIHGNLEILNLLLKHGAEIDTYLSPLLAAIEEGHVPVVKKLLEAGATPHLITPDGKTPMSFALSGGNPEMINLVSEKTAPFFLSMTAHLSPPRAAMTALTLTPALLGGVPAAAGGSGVGAAAGAGHAGRAP